MLFGIPTPRYAATTVLLGLLAASASGIAHAQDGELPTAPAQMPDSVTAPALKARFGVQINNYNNGNVRGAIVVGVVADSPATQVKVNRRRSDGSVVTQTTTMVRGDIITELLVPWEGELKIVKIRKYQDLIDAIQDLPANAKFEVRGYDAGNGYKKFTASAKLQD